MYRKASFVVFACVIAAGLSNPAIQLGCPDVTTNCEVSNVDITPCANKQRCGFKLGKNASISFDFTPDFSASELLTEVTTTFQGNTVSLEGFDKEACKYTSCPAEAGKKQTLTYQLHLSRAQMVKGSFELRWTVWNKVEPTQICCFQTRIKIN